MTVFSQNLTKTFQQVATDRYWFFRFFARLSKRSIHYYDEWWLFL